jgi:hypothetical protein
LVDSVHSFGLISFDNVGGDSTVVLQTVFRPILWLCFYFAFIIRGMVRGSDPSINEKDKKINLEVLI